MGIFCPVSKHSLQVGGYRVSKHSLRKMNVSTHFTQKSSLCQRLQPVPAFMGSQCSQQSLQGAAQSGLVG
jgi:hypothetical protein